jgi:hypothetical protein
MAGQRTQPADGPQVAVVVPPVRARVKASHTKPETIAALVDAMQTDGAWATDGESYKTYKLASNASQVHRRAVAHALRIPVKRVQSRVWESSDTFPPKERTADGLWVFALRRKVDAPAPTPTPAAA